MTEIVVPVLLAALVAAPAFGSECRMTRAFMQPDVDAPGKATPVWSDGDTSALFFIEALNVNTDGTRRSYSIEDFWGEATALNNVCNAMSDACEGLDREGKRERRIRTQKALADGWPPEALAETKISKNIIPFKGGKPCPLVDGYLVSATALQKPNIADPCDITNYVDALTIAALVVPGKPKDGPSEFATRGTRVGDLVVAMRPGAAEPVYAVVGDTGPWNKLGEGSVALNARLLGKSEEPRNYADVKQHWVVPRALVIVFPKTRDVTNPYMTAPRIEEAAKKRFEEWGGVARLEACATEYARP